MNSSPVTAIRPLPPGSERPLWSVMIPTYHCARYLAQTLESVLAQDPGPEQMQIEVVDDCSQSDNPEAVVAEVGRGRVSFYRQPANVGHVRNFNTCLARAQGRLVHLLHGDDYVCPGFYRTMARPFGDHPSIGAAFCRDIRVDEQDRVVSVSRPLAPVSGILDGWLETIAAGQRLQAPAMVVRRAVYEQLGGFDERVQAYGEDWEMWVRIAARYPVWYQRQSLAVYRVRRAGLSGRTVRSGENGDDMRRVIQLNRQHLPPGQAAALSRQAGQNFALACLRRGHRLVESGPAEAVLAQGREAVRTSRSPRVLARATYLFWRWFVRFHLLPLYVSVRRGRFS